MKNWIRRRPVAAYLLLAYLLTWSISLVLLVQRRGWANPGLSLHWEAIAAFGPAVAALIVVRVVEGGAGLRNWIASLAHWRVGARWLLFSGASPLALLLAAAVALRIGSGAWPDFAPLATGKLASGAGLFELVVIAGLAQGLGEEPGWRGFLLPRLRRRWAPLVATLILFPAWLFWHLPAFLGRPQFGLAQWFAFSLGVLSAAVWLTLIRERTGSVLMAVLWHLMVNVARGIALAVSLPMFLAFSALVTVGALLMVLSGGLRGTR